MALIIGMAAAQTRPGTIRKPPPIPKKPESRRAHRRRREGAGRREWNLRRRSGPAKNRLLRRRGPRGPAAAVRSLWGCGGGFRGVEDRLEWTEAMLLQREVVCERRERSVHRLFGPIRIIRIEMIAMRPRLTVDIGRDIPGVIVRKHRRVVMRPERHIGVNERGGGDHPVQAGPVIEAVRTPKR